MTGAQRKLFSGTVERFFKVVEASPATSPRWAMKVAHIKNIGHLDNRSVIHHLAFVLYRDGQEHVQMTVKHYAYKLKNNVEKRLLDEVYGFYPSKKNKFAFMRRDSLSSDNDQACCRLFDRWSRIDVDDLLRKLELKLVEMI